MSCLTRPPPVSTTKAPGVLYFRGSITRPLTSLSTLRRMGRPTTTQDSLLAAGPALPGGIRTRKGFSERFQRSSLFLLSKAYLTQGHHTHLLCFFQGTELRDSVRFGERSPRLDPVGVSVISAPPAPLVANAEPLERSKSGGSGRKAFA